MTFLPGAVRPPPSDASFASLHSFARLIIFWTAQQPPLKCIPELWFGHRVNSMLPLIIFAHPLKMRNLASIFDATRLSTVVVIAAASQTRASSYS